jgi:transposase-like protein
VVTRKKRARIFSAWLLKRQTPRIRCVWVADKIEQTLSIYRVPQQDHENLKCTNMLEPLIGDHPKIIRMFSNPAACFGARAGVAIETHENWIRQRSTSTRNSKREQKRTDCENRECDVLLSTRLMRL